MSVFEDIPNQLYLIDNSAGDVVMKCVNAEEEIDLSLHQIRQTITNELHGSPNPSDVCASIPDVILNLTSVKNIVIFKHLAQWKQDQISFSNDPTIQANKLDKIQTWFEELANLILEARTHIQTIPSTTYSHNQEQLITLLEALISNGFVVEKQPPQVLTTYKRFAVTVRHLLGNFSEYNTSTEVEVLLVSKAHGEIKNNRKAFGFNAGKLTCEFTNLKLSKRPTQVKQKECVLDEKYALSIHAVFRTNDMQVNIHVASQPAVIIVNGNQEHRAWATIVWDNVFAASNRVAFEVEEQVQWPKLATALSRKFASDFGCQLSDENLRYLREKIYQKEANLIPVNYPVTWSQFYKQPIYSHSKKKYTFWAWFYAAMKLTHEYLVDAWNAGFIAGFVSKDRVDQLLLTRPHGTFLLRFSETVLGGLTINWVTHDSNRGPKVMKMSPFVENDLRVHSLSQRVLDLKECITLYPDIPKHESFGRMSKPKRGGVKGYVSPILKLVLLNQDEDKSNSPEVPVSPSNFTSSTLVQYDTSVDSTFSEDIELPGEVVEFMQNRCLM